MGSVPPPPTVAVLLLRSVAASFGMGKAEDGFGVISYTVGPDDVEGFIELFVTCYLQYFLFDLTITLTHHMAFV